jgi:glycine cleavage system H protein
VSLPIHLKYTRDHYWIRLEGERAVIGLTEIGIIELGMILYIELPERETVLNRGEYIGSVETVESERDLLSPLSGKVTDVNILLEKTTLLLHESPYDKGWLFAIQWSQESELEQLWDAEAYELNNPME